MDGRLRDYRRRMDGRWKKDGRSMDRGMIKDTWRMNGGYPENGWMDKVIRRRMMDEGLRLYDGRTEDAC